MLSPGLVLGFAVGGRFGVLLICSVGDGASVPGAGAEMKTVEPCGGFVVLGDRVVEVGPG
jgi:hypothetical protein